MTLLMCFNLALTIGVRRTAPETPLQLVLSDSTLDLALDSLNATFDDSELR